MSQIDFVVGGRRLNVCDTCGGACCGHWVKGGAFIHETCRHEGGSCGGDGCPGRMRATTEPLHVAAPASAPQDAERGRG